MINYVVKQGTYFILLYFVVIKDYNNLSKELSSKILSYFDPFNSTPIQLKFSKAEAIELRNHIRSHIQVVLKNPITHCSQGYLDLFNHLSFVTNENKRIIENKAQCSNCGDIITSAISESPISCKCGKLIISGGVLELNRNGEFKELSVLE